MKGAYGDLSWYEAVQETSALTLDLCKFGEMSRYFKVMFGTSIKYTFPCSYSITVVFKFK